jgi:hypothetical protein
MIKNLPSDIHNGLKTIPTNNAVALIIRHSIRENIPEGQVGKEAGLTYEGKILAKSLGALIGNRLSSVTTSPIDRCKETAEYIISGASLDFSFATSTLLGDPGVFISDSELAWQNFQALGTAGVMLHLANKDYALPGMRIPRIAAKELLTAMLNITKPGIHLFISHDVIVSGIAGQLFGGIETNENLPNYLEGAFFWKEGHQTLGMFRNYKMQIVF